MYPNLNTDTYTEDNIGICEGGDVGGDIQASDSWERRFALDLGDGTFSVVSLTAYWAFDELPPVGVDYDENDLPKNITVQAYYAHCTDLDDVGGTESHADYRYWTNQDGETPRDRIVNLTREDINEAVNQMAA